MHYYVYIHIYYVQYIHIYMILYMYSFIVSKEVLKSNFRLYGQMEKAEVSRVREERRRRKIKEEKVRRKKIQVQEKAGKSVFVQ